MKFFEKEVGKFKAKDKMKRSDIISISFDSHETVSIEIGSSCTLRLSEQEVDLLRLHLMDASVGCMRVRNQKAELEATAKVLGHPEVK